MKNTEKDIKIALIGDSLVLGKTLKKNKQIKNWRAKTIGVKLQNMLNEAYPSCSFYIENFD